MQLTSFINLDGVRFRSFPVARSHPSLEDEVYFHRFPPALAVMPAIGTLIEQKDLALGEKQHLRGQGENKPGACNLLQAP